MLKMLKTIKFVAAITSFIASAIFCIILFVITFISFFLIVVLFFFIQSIFLSKTKKLFLKYRAELTSHKPLFAQ